MKTKTNYACQDCGHQSSRWLGKCPECQSWNSFVEEAIIEKTHRQQQIVERQDKAVLLRDVQTATDERFRVGIKEVDRVLGGGLAAGAVTLIGGDPGIGKSTLTLQMVSLLSQQGLKVLYISGEESIQQTKMRSQRLGVLKADSLYIINQVEMPAIRNLISQLKPDVLVIDSIQVIFDPEISSSPGSVSQVRECAATLTQIAKATGMALFIIGHVTKEGMIAGPKVLEHIVDTVLYIEGERYTSYRILRTMKNRFGSTHEMGVFEMTGEGLKEVDNPSEIFLSERSAKISGSVVVPILEGTRPFLVEIQGLVTRSSFGMVRHKAQGYDANRLALLVAVLEKRLDLNLQDKDIFLNVVGGVRIMDPAADLAVGLAVASALLDRVIDFKTVVMGEVGLGSEVRSVSQINLRINEAAKLGFKKCFLPKNNLKAQKVIKDAGIELIGVENVREALDHLTK